MLCVTCASLKELGREGCVGLAVEFKYQQASSRIINYTFNIQALQRMNTDFNGRLTPLDKSSQLYLYSPISKITTYLKELSSRASLSTHFSLRVTWTSGVAKVLDFPCFYVVVLFCVSPSRFQFSLRKISWNSDLIQLQSDIRLLTGFCPCMMYVCMVRVKLEEFICRWHENHCCCNCAAVRELNLWGRSYRSDSSLSVFVWRAAGLSSFLCVSCSKSRTSLSRQRIFRHFSKAETKKQRQLLIIKEFNTVKYEHRRIQNRV